MKSLCTMVVASAIVVASAAPSQAQTGAAAQTDVYHVMFVKAVPGQAAVVATELQQLDPKDPLASHFVLLRHQVFAALENPTRKST